MNDRATVDGALIDLARRLADVAGPIARRYFRAGVDVMDKSDDSPVTRADREIEAALRAILAAERPEDGILGEEYGTEREDAELLWVLDPIDGTKSFITGKPLFGTLIALTHNRRPILGVIDHPITGERWVGAEGHGTTLNGRPAHGRDCATLAEAYLYSTAPDMFTEENGAAGPYGRLSAAVKLPLFGADCYAYGLLASGHVDIVCEACLQPYDYCAVAPVVEGAGGIITDWAGAPLTVDSGDRVLAAGDARTHALALAALSAP